MKECLEQYIGNSGRFSTFPSMCAAATGDRSCGVLQWVAQSVENLSISVGGCDMTGREAVFAGWEALQSVMNSWGIRSGEGLSEWIHGQGFFPLPPLFSFFLTLLGVVSWNFGVIEGRDLQMFTFGVAGCRVKPQRPKFQKKKSLSLSPKTKKHKKTKQQKKTSPKIKKNVENISPDQKIKKNPKINNKINNEKMLKERKSNQNFAQTRKIKIK